MEALLAFGLVILLLVVFALGPVIAMIDVVSGELAVSDDQSFDSSRLLKGMVVLLVPLAWIFYFVLIRRRLPFA